MDVTGCDEQLSEVAEILKGEATLAPFLGLVMVIPSALALAPASLAPVLLAPVLLPPGSLVDGVVGLDPGGVVVFVMVLTLEPPHPAATSETRRSIKRVWGDWKRRNDILLIQ